ncbi:hypothetical protein COO60DRAFT_493363 [Scenedesmus sp. NREL 46B-D3]|nr:hypothetical protein COO60DRAFT_493363 [Scenedesmus sp. NREL 46B-D3]
MLLKLCLQGCKCLQGCHLLCMCCCASATAAWPPVLSTAGSWWCHPSCTQEHVICTYVSTCNNTRYYTALKARRTHETVAASFQCITGQPGIQDLTL